ncbi:MAG TPA: methionyl-tRNA formyltransferase [Gammaproteobacteria bacterium]
MPVGTAPRIVFAGTPDFAVPSLRALAASGAEIPLVLTQPDRPAGRGRRLSPPPVKRAAAELGLRVAQPEALSDASAPEAWGLADERPDLMLVVAYGLLLPRWARDWPRLGCVNVHASLLPRWRGAAPIQHAILGGDAVTGVTLMRIEAGLDSGPIYAARETPIGADETAGELHDRLAELGAALAAETLPRILAGTIEPIPQDDTAKTYAPKLDKRDARLDWRAPAIDLARRVRAFNPWPVAYTVADDGRVIRILAAAARPAAPEAERIAPGRIVAAGRDGIDVATGEGVLRLLRIQPPSSRVMDAAAYLAAHRLDGVTFV